MRAALAIASVVLLLLGAAAPHAHAGNLGQHGCVACVAAGAEEAGPATPDLTPRPVNTVLAVATPTTDPVSGAPLGAVPGQSPPGA